MKIQNNKKPTNGIKMRRLTIASIMMSIVLTMGALDPVMASMQTANDQIIPADVAINTIKQNAPVSLTADQLDNVKRIVLSDSRVQAMINGEKFEFMGQSFLGNIKQIPIVWHPVLNINVNNQTDVAVEVNMANNSVIQIQKSGLHKTTTSYPGVGDPAFATDYFTGSATITGVFATLTNPTVSNSPKVFFLVNGIESGANDANGCIPADKSSDYFGQSGLNFWNGYAMYTDTSFSCFTNNAMIPYTAGDLYLGEIYSSTGPKWNIITLDQNSGLSHMYTTTFTTASSNLKTSDPNTSVWLENQMTSTNWASDFSTSIQAANAKYYSSGWTLWGSDTQTVQDCSGNTKTQNVMNNNLVSGHTQTWNATKFETWHC
jgi:hypothetical protein